MKSLLPLVLAVVLPVRALVAQCTGMSMGNPEPDPRAQEVLDRAFKAAGGVDAVSGLQRLELKSRATLYSLGQSATPDSPLREQHNEVVQRWDLAGRRSIREENSLDPDRVRKVRRVLLPDGGFFYDLSTKVVRRYNAVTAAPVAATEMSVYAYDLMLKARARPAMVRALPDESAEGQSQRVLGFTPEDGTLTKLYFNSATGLLSRTAAYQYQDLLGDHLVETRFDGYRAVSGVQLPHRVTVTTGGYKTLDAEFSEITTPGGWDDNQLQVPTGGTEGPPFPAPTPDASAPLTVTTLGDGAYLIPNAAPNYNVLFVAFNDFIFVGETPGTAETSKRIMAKIKETVPGKPIRYAMPTHYHFDHSGGLWGYLSEGVTIVTNPGNKAFVERVAAAQRTRAPAGVGRTGPAPRLELFTDKKTITDGKQSIQLYNVGVNPHVDDIDVVYLPAQKTLLVADLFSFTGQVVAANPNAVAFAQKLRDLKLDVKTIIPVHGQSTGIETLWKSVEMAGKN